MKTKRIPALIMLLGGSVACIFSYINRYDLKDMLVVVTLSLVIFLVIGVIVRLMLDSFDMPEEEKVDDDGEVVEKQNDSSEGEAENNQDNEESTNII